MALLNIGETPKSGGVLLEGPLEALYKSNHTSSCPLKGLLVQRALVAKLEVTCVLGADLDGGVRIAFPCGVISLDTVKNTLLLKVTTGRRRKNTGQGRPGSEVKRQVSVGLVEWRISQVLLVSMTDCGAGLF